MYKLNVNKNIILKMLNELCLNVNKIKLDNILRDPNILMITKNHTLKYPMRGTTDREILMDIISINLIGMKWPLYKDSKQYSQLFWNKLDKFLLTST